MFLKGISFYFFYLGFYNASETKSAARKLTKTSSSQFLLSKIMNERLHIKTIQDIIRKKHAKNTDNFLGKLSYSGLLRAR